MQKQVKEPGTFLFPAPPVLVSCGEMEKETNIITIAWTGTLNSKPPKLGIAVNPNRYSFNLLKKNGEFVVNLPDEQMVWATDYCGSVSGQDVDKFAQTGFTPKSGQLVSAPLISEAPLNLECVIMSEQELGSHNLFIAEVKQVHMADNLQDEQGKMDIFQGNIISFGGKGYYKTGEQLYRRGQSLSEY